MQLSTSASIHASTVVFCFNFHPCLVCLIVLFRHVYQSMDPFVCKINLFAICSFFSTSWEKFFCSSGIFNHIFAKIILHWFMNVRQVIKILACKVLYLWIFLFLPRIFLTSSCCISLFSIIVSELVKFYVIIFVKNWKHNELFERSILSNTCKNLSYQATTRERGGELTRMTKSIAAGREC